MGFPFDHTLANTQRSSFKGIFEIKEYWVHVAFWICFIPFPLGLSLSALGFIEPLFISRVFLSLALLYINYLFLVPELLLKKKMALYVLTSLACLLTVNVLINYLLFPVPEKKLIELAQKNVGVDIDLLKRAPYALSLIFSTAFFMLGGILALIKDFYRKDRINREIMVQRKDTELQFLKAQLNPHFLFNSLNSIYSLVRNKSQKAPEAVIVLSELMRYMLYETKDDFVPLSKEIEYIKNYTELQRIRLKDDSDVVLSIDDCEESDKKIPPLLLIPFVENAFKYGTGFSGKTDVGIKLHIAGETLFFTIRNTINDYKKDKKNSGIGLKNIRDRLQLIYPENHQLTIFKDASEYLVKLEINLGR